jgi:ATP-dependent DNA helicase RecG
MGLPDFADKVTSFVVTMPNHSLLDDQTLHWLSGLGREGLRDSQCIGLAMMRRGAVMDNTRYRAATGIVDSRVATFELQDLVARELVVQTGTRRGARYSLAPYAASEGEGQRRPRPNRRRQILDVLKLLGEASKAEIAAELRLNPKSVEHWLQQMKSEATIEPTLPGRSKNTRYRVSGAVKQSEL